VTPEGLISWREKSHRDRLHANRVLRTAQAFFNALVISGAGPENPLRAVEPLAPPAPTDTSDAGHTPTTNA
jgi:hypothetical protein